MMPLTTTSFMLRSSLALSFPAQKRMDITYLYWLQSLLHRFLHTNEEPRLTAVVPLRLYEQWEQDGNELLTLMDAAAKTANLSPEAADKLTAQAVKAVRAQARAKKSG